MQSGWTSNALCSGQYAINGFQTGLIQPNPSTPFYTDSAFCRWNITGPPNSVLSFETFNTECKYDYLTVLDSNTIVAKLCGNSQFDPIVTSSNSLSLVFQSDSTGVSTGFRAQGLLCERPKSVYQARQDHSVAYDPSNDVSFLFGGRSWSQYGQPDTIRNDLSVYYHQNDTWRSITPTNVPIERYDHYSWIYRDQVYVFGGSNGQAKLLDMIKYDPIQNTWIPLPASTIQEMATIQDPIYTIDLQENDFVLYWFKLYKYTLSKNTWTAVSTAPFTYQTGTGMYHREQNALFFHAVYWSMDYFGNKRIYTWKYQLDADQWSAVSSRSVDKLRFGSSLSFDADFGYITGGLRESLLTTNDASQQPTCFPSLVQIFDPNCQNFTEAELQGFSRVNHASIIRNNVLHLFGGTNGIMYGDIKRLPLSSLTLPSNNRTLCKLQNYCANVPSCTKCQKVPFCSWCGSCGIQAQAFGITLPPSTSTRLGQLVDGACPFNSTVSVCPIPKKLAIGQLETSSLSWGTFVDYQVEMDSTTGSNFDFVLTPPKNTNLRLTLLSYTPYTPTTLKGFIRVSQLNYANLYYSQIYTIRVSWADDVGVVFSPNDPQTPIDPYTSDNAIFSLRASYSNNNSSNGWFQGSEVVTIFLALIAVSTFGSVITYCVRRRQINIILRRRQQLVEMRAITAEPPPLYRVQLDITKKRQSLIASSPISAASIQTVVGNTRVQLQSETLLIVLPGMEQDQLPLLAFGTRLSLEAAGPYGTLLDHNDRSRFYENNVNCKWVLTSTDPNYGYKIQFTQLNTECGWDFVNIYDGSNDSARAIAKLCGNRDSYRDTFVSTSNALTVQFTSDISVNAPGFVASFTKVPRTRCTLNSCLNGGQCIGDVCQCPSGFSGTLCETAVPQMYAPREQHSIAYDKTNAVAYLTFGRSWGTFASQTQFDDLWQFGHYSFFHGNQLYIFGGQKSDRTILSDLWRFSPQNQTWSVISPYPVISNFAEAICQYVPKSTLGFKLYVFGYQQQLYLYDSDDNAWSIASQAPVNFVSGSFIYHKETNSLFLVSGYPTVEQYMLSRLYYAWKYQIDTGVWTPTSKRDMQGLRMYDSSLAVSNDYAIVSGGLQLAYQYDPPSNECYPATYQVLDIACQSWSAVRVSGIGRRGHAAISNDTHLFVFGGSNGTMQNANTYCSSIPTCNQCNQLSYCQWCNGACGINNQTLGLQVTSQPRSRNNTLLGYLDNGFCPFVEYVFALKTTAGGDVPIRMTLLYLPPTNPTTLTRQIVLGSGSIYYKSTTYTVRVSLGNDNGVLGNNLTSQTGSMDTSVNFTLSVTYGSSLSGNWLTDQGTYNILAIAFVSGLLVGGAYYQIRQRMLERRRYERRLQRMGIELNDIPREPPVLYRVMLDLAPPTDPHMLLRQKSTLAQESPLSSEKLSVTHQGQTNQVRSDTVLIMMPRARLELENRELPTVSFGLHLAIDNQKRSIYGTFRE
ncbi:hypothetical protein EDD86DRAFT_243913 [Gorgonomyces haynaldii]|nr:hypothetical protein EDD86DRAFT_243913 [Gorgonomyces haynaldii]